MSYQLFFHPEFENDVTRMALFIAEKADEDAALKASDRADEALASLADNPHRVAPRDDIMPDLRITLFRRSGVIAYLVDVARSQVFVLGLFYGGQEWDRHILSGAKSMVSSWNRIWSQLAPMSRAPTLDHGWMSRGHLESMKICSQLNFDSTPCSESQAS